MWSMPRNVLRIVAFILAACAVGGFVMGIRSTPERARLPGEGAAGPALEASDARPLEAIAEDLRRRDERDRTRAEAPLREAADAVIIDTSEMDIAEAVAAAIAAADRIAGRR